MIYRVILKPFIDLYMNKSLSERIWRNWKILTWHLNVDVVVVEFFSDSFSIFLQSILLPLEKLKILIWMWLTKRVLAPNRCDITERRFRSDSIQPKDMRERTKLAYTMCVRKHAIFCALSVAILAQAALAQGHWHSSPHCFCSHQKLICWQGHLKDTAWHRVRSS